MMTRTKAKPGDATITEGDRSYAKRRPVADSVALLFRRVALGLVDEKQLVVEVRGLAPRVVGLVEDGTIATPTGWDALKPQKAPAPQIPQKAPAKAKGRKK